MFAAFDSDAEHGSKPSHLLLGQLMVLIVLQARVQSTFDYLMLLQKVSDMKSITGTLQDPSLQGFDSSESEVAVEWTGVGSETVGCEINLLVELLVFEDQCSHDQISMPSDVFGETVKNDVSA